MLISLAPKDLDFVLAVPPTGVTDCGNKLCWRKAVMAWFWSFASTTPFCSLPCESSAT